MAKLPELAPEDFQCPLPITEHDTVQLAHGSGGRMMNDLIRKLFAWAFENPILSRLDDFALLEVGSVRLAFTTDSFVVDPIFFPGGDIGELAVNGTVNDLAMSGARPLFLSVGVILEEGFSLEELRQVVVSMKKAAKAAGVQIVTGDTKVVNRGKGDKIFLNTAGIGIVERPFVPSASQIKPGDQILVSGTIGDHGMAILSRREGLSFETPIRSDTAALHELVREVLDVGGESVHALRDPTRGGLAAVLNEFAAASGVGLRIFEEAIPVREEVAAACDLLGLDPLYVANEGKMVAAVAPEKADEVLEAMRRHPLGKMAARIGEAVEESPGLVSMQTVLGAWRIVDLPVGEQLPRIC